MKNNARHIRWFLGIVAVLLCLVVCRVDAAMAGSTPVQSAGAVSVVHDTYEAACASLSEKENDMLRAAHEMGQWGIPSSSVTLQGTVGRVVTLGEALQRIGRVQGALVACGPSCGNGQAEALRHTLLNKRFHAGYYIYYRCQMRC